MNLDDFDEKFGDLRVDHYDRVYSYIADKLREFGERLKTSEIILKGDEPEEKVMRIMAINVERNRTNAQIDKELKQLGC